MVAGHHGRPAAVEQSADVGEGVRNAQPGGRVERALPVELRPVPARSTPGPDGRVRAVGDRRRADSRLAIGPDVEERGALRRADPLVEVARVPRGPDRGQVERQHPRRVRAVDERLDAALGERRDDPGDREDERRRARDVAEDGDPGPVGDRVEDRVDDLVLIATGNGIRATTTRAPVALGDVAEDVEDGVVLVVVGQELVAGAEAERAEDRVRPRPSRWRRTRGRRDRRRGRREHAARLGEKAGRSRARNWTGRASSRSRQLALALEHRPRARAERAVVEEGDRRVEGPERGEGRRHPRIMPGTLGPWVPSTRWSRSSSC